MRGYKLYNNLQNIVTGITGQKARLTDWSNLHLLSIHIPKTAGTSFLHTLKNAYGSAQVIRVDINQKVWINKIPKDKAFVCRRPVVIHGHFSLETLKDEFDIPSDLPVITWLRDPVERVISNYYYLSKILKQATHLGQRDHTVLQRMQKTLLQFAQEENNQNRMTKFLEGIHLEDLFFVGIVERYEADCYELAKKLQWKNIKPVQQNITGSYKKVSIDEATRALIRSYNRKDDQLYQKVLQRKDQYP